MYISLREIRDGSTKKKSHQRRLSRRNLFHRGILQASTRDPDNDNDEVETMKEKKE